MEATYKKHSVESNDSTDELDLHALMMALDSEDGLARQHARKSLVEAGQTAVSALEEALSNPHEHVRWEAAKALRDIGDPAAADALANALEDQSFGVRWLAAEGLATMERAGLEAVLRALTTHHDSYALRESAHHVLRLLAQVGWRESVTPVLIALESVEAYITVPRAAWDALQGMATDPTAAG